MAEDSSKPPEQAGAVYRPARRRELSPATDAAPRIDDRRALPSSDKPQEAPAHEKESTAAGPSSAQAQNGATSRTARGPAGAAPGAAEQRSGQAAGQQATGQQATGQQATGRQAAGQQAAGRQARASQPAIAAAGDVKIGLWGSPSSGKTTFLGALRHAVDTDRTSGRWIVHPANEESADLMVELTQTLVDERAFPPATHVGEETELRWRFIGDLAGSQFDRRMILRRRGALPSEFTLNLVDVSGEAFGRAPHEKNVPLDVIEDALDHLASAQGLIYLFDPISELEHRNSAEYLNRTIIALSRRMLAENRLVNGYLPHYLSVCVTKFDHPMLFDKACEAHLVNAGPDGVPRILDQDAERLFELVCDGGFWRGEYGEEAATSARFIRNELKSRFHPDRTRYFVTSAVGFRQPPDADPGFGGGPPPGVHPRHYANVYELNGESRIHGPIAPINVLEPLVSLNQFIAQRKARG